MAAVVGEGAVPPQPPAEGVGGEAAEGAAEAAPVIVPPLAIRRIVDKTAKFVGTHGDQFEERVRKSQGHNAQFSFLEEGDAYHAFYRKRLADVKAGTFVEETEEAAAAAEEEEEKKKKEAQAAAAGGEGGEAGGEGGEGGDGAQAAPEGTTVTASISKAAVRGVLQRPEQITEPPKAWATLVHGAVSALDLDIIKLTAQYVALHGRNFLGGLLTREGRNQQFDFLKPQHPLHRLFTTLVDAYAHCAAAADELVESMRNDIGNKRRVLTRCINLMEWERQETRKRLASMQEEREQLTIDWQDFKIVETVVFTDAERANTALPPPLTLQQIQYLNLQSGAKAVGAGAGARGATATATTATAATATTTTTPATGAAAGGGADDGDDDDVDMDVSSDEEMDLGGDSDEEDEEEAAGVVAEQDEDALEVRSDYERKPVKPVVEGHPTVFTYEGKTIPVEEASEHLRVETLNPQWKQQRDAQLEIKRREGSALADGEEMAKQLASFARQRTDLFGGDEEARKAEERRMRALQEEKLKNAWDGHAASRQTTRAARMSQRDLHEMEQRRQQQVEEELRRQQQGPAEPSAEDERAAKRQRMQ